MPDTQYCEVKFRPEDRRAYTYHNDGDPYAVGDRVEVDARGSVKVVEIVAISKRAPPYATKPILRPAPKPKAEEAVPDDPLDGVGDG